MTSHIKQPPPPRPPQQQEQQTGSPELQPEQQQSSGGGSAAAAAAGVTKDQWYKTKMCPFFERGRCYYQDSCCYAHSDAELRPLPDLNKTSLCKKFAKTGECNDSACPFAHGSSDLRCTGGFFKTKLCNMWKKGRCDAGQLCRHAHGHSELRISRNLQQAAKTVSAEPQPLVALAEKLQKVERDSGVVSHTAGHKGERERGGERNRGDFHSSGSRPAAGRREKGQAKARGKENVRSPQRKNGAENAVVTTTDNSSSVWQRGRIDDGPVQPPSVPSHVGGPSSSSSSSSQIPPSSQSTVVVASGDYPRSVPSPPPPIPRDALAFPPLPVSVSQEHERERHRRNRSRSSTVLHQHHQPRTRRDTAGGDQNDPVFVIDSREGPAHYPSPASTEEARGVSGESLARTTTAPWPSPASTTFLSFHPDDSRHSPSSASPPSHTDMRPPPPPPSTPPPWRHPHAHGHTHPVAPVSTPAPPPPPPNASQLQCDPWQPPGRQPGTETGSVSLSQTTTEDTQNENERETPPLPPSPPFSAWETNQSNHPTRPPPPPPPPRVSTSSPSSSPHPLHHQRPPHPPPRVSSHNPQAAVQPHHPNSIWDHADRSSPSAPVSSNPPSGDMSEPHSTAPQGSLRASHMHSHVKEAGGGPPLHPLKPHLSAESSSAARQSRPDPHQHRERGQGDMQWEYAGGVMHKTEKEKEQLPSSFPHTQQSFSSTEFGIDFRPSGFNAAVGGPPSSSACGGVSAASPVSTAVSVSVSGMKTSHRDGGGKRMSGEGLIGHGEAVAPLPAPAYGVPPLSPAESSCAARSLGSHRSHTHTPSNPLLHPPHAYGASPVVEERRTLPPVGPSSSSISPSSSAGSGRPGTGPITPSRSCLGGPPTDVPPHLPHAAATRNLSSSTFAVSSQVPLHQQTRRAVPTAETPGTYCEDQAQATAAQQQQSYRHHHQHFAVEPEGTMTSVSSLSDSRKGTNGYSTVSESHTHSDIWGPRVGLSAHSGSRGMNVEGRQMRSGGQEPLPSSSFDGPKSSTDAQALSASLGPSGLHTGPVGAPFPLLSKAYSHRESSSHPCDDLQQGQGGVLLSASASSPEGHGGRGEESESRLGMNTST
eukprot:Cvel_16490.t1-p1 / transcript=Cvel_16490.t1 / gene=Cvel_16490 / organism=Chromera_velia_CCMP2878 / gene_product=Cleavage and polyadenylation specificity factor, putative / transcript_product=Cleavage and polyadenylation specificity factor, putative / location=Cvel_scaffold1271:46015-51211(+) / protein_length=1099 / sequence_SO=supercontig / SO=protein_coding / is_pseudo=false